MERGITTWPLAGKARLHRKNFCPTFSRVLSQAPQYGFTVAQARTILMKLKQSRTVHFGFMADANDVSRLPGVLATLDERIPGAFVLPI